MTAEIAVLNQEAVALAADSAVTGPKIFTSANKIFSLSQYHPVGVMVYNNAQFLGVPWETIIKSYRKDLGKRSFATLRDQAAHFLGYFDQPNRMFSEPAQRNSARAVFTHGLAEIRDRIDERLEDLLDSRGPLTKRDVSSVTGSAINQAHRAWMAAHASPALPDDHASSVIASYEAEIDQAIDAAFEMLPLTPLRRGKLRDIAGALVSRGAPNRDGPFHSGVVIAGFGRHDVFPGLYSFEFEAITLNRLKYVGGQEIEISPESRAVIVPFAQKEQVDTFMTGFDPSLSFRVQAYWESMPYAIEDAVASVKALSDESRKDLVVALRKRCEELLVEYSTGLQEIIHGEYVWPIIRVVAMLPKDELAAMAESLVNLTSFKRKISEQAETVGGPIDVAVISKGDGFVWIKRKHYFLPELNRQFLANYNREDL